MADTTAIQLAINSLGETPTGDQILGAMDMIQALKEFVKLNEPTVKLAIAAHIGRTGEPLKVTDTLQWKMSKKKEVKCPDVVQGSNKILEITGGDLTKYFGCLSSNALKPGETKTVLKEFGAEDRFGEVFTTVWKDDVELVLIDTKFIK